MNLEQFVFPHEKHYLNEYRVVFSSRGRHFQNEGGGDVLQTPPQSGDRTDEVSSWRCNPGSCTLCTPTTRGEL